MAITLTTNPASFKAEAQFQRVCAVCGYAGQFEAHHVVSKNRLKREGLGHLLWDSRNALRVCPRCHSLHTQRVSHIVVADLTPENLCFVWEALKTAGQTYLERQYGGIDRRFTLHQEGSCPLCQVRRP